MKQIQTEYCYNKICPIAAPHHSQSTTSTVEISALHFTILGDEELSANDGLNTPKNENKQGLLRYHNGMTGEKSGSRSLTLTKQTLAHSPVCNTPALDRTE